LLDKVENYIVFYTQKRRTELFTLHGLLSKITQSQNRRSRLILLHQQQVIIKIQGTRVLFTLLINCQSDNDGGDDDAELNFIRELNKFLYSHSPQADTQTYFAAAGILVDILNSFSKQSSVSSGVVWCGVAACCDSFSGLHNLLFICCCLN